MKHLIKDTQKTTEASNPPITQRLKRVNSLGILESPFKNNNNNKFTFNQTSIKKDKYDKFRQFTSQLTSIKSQLQKYNLDNLDQQSQIQSCYMSNLSSQQSIKSFQNSIKRKSQTNLDTYYQLNDSQFYRNRVNSSNYSLNKFKKYNIQTVEEIKNGRGRKVYENGFLYEGEMLDGLRSGNGTLRDSNLNIIYQGEWFNDHFEGRGRLINLDYQEDKFNLNSFKQFQLVQHQFTTYEGEFRNGQFFGQGVMSFKCEGELFKFIGGFSQDLFHGIGTLQQNDQIILQGKWIYGCMV
ncbi:unnamed protein product [Paramecium sonneborni]|uniref:Uncharacterized protein n=1 Tax=Paramecium sonneborni TaxID=65129 RepID=A0A8S1Q2F2_9CILI|nr:unnamed protein product [Paramecium sonneborni]